MATLLRVPVVQYLAAAVALAVETSTHLVDFGVYDLRIRVLNSAYEWSYSHMLATLAFAMGTFIAAIGASAGGRRRAAWWTLCGLFAFLSLDNMSRLHEHVGSWPLLYAPILAGLTLSVVAVARGTEQAPVVYAALGLLFGSLAIHVLGPSVVRALGWGPNGWAYQVKVALKEGTELAGWVMLVPSLALLARRPFGARRVLAGRLSDG